MPKTIEKSDLLDPTSTEKLSDREKEVVEDAERAGTYFGSSVPDRENENLIPPRDTGGVIEQTIDSKAVKKFGRPGDESDISGGDARRGQKR